MAKDYYSTLGIAEDAPIDQIKASYRSLAFANHPDKNPGDKAAEERFKEISEAYSVLSDPGKRSQYDQMRTYGGPSFQQAPGGQQGFGFAFSREMAYMLFLQEMSQLAAELTMRGVSKEKIAQELVAKGCPAEAAAQIAANYAGKKAQLFKRSAQMQLNLGATLLLVGAFLFVSPFRIFSYLAIAGGLYNLLKGGYSLFRSRFPGKSPA